MKIAAIALAASVFALPVLAQDLQQADRNVFILSGPMGAGDMADMVNPFDVRYENAIVLGAGYQQFFGEPVDNFRVGLEVGGAVRAGSERTTGEIWGGVVGRHDGIVVGDGLRISPALTFGVSVVDGTMGSGGKDHDGLPGNVLFYLSPKSVFRARKILTPNCSGASTIGRAHGTALAAAAVPTPRQSGSGRGFSHSEPYWLQWNRFSLSLLRRTRESMPRHARKLRRRAGFCLLPE